MLKGIILAGGTGTRLHPITKAICKQLLPVYNKPMIYYPLQTLIDLNISDILIIGPDLATIRLYETLLQNVDDVNISYKVQKSPRGLAEAFIIGKDFIGNDDVAMILGDNIFINNKLKDITPNTIFTYTVSNPEAYGVAVRNSNNTLEYVIEKPTEHISDEAVVGLYVFDSRVSEIAKSIKPSKRGELEITSVINRYNELGDINVMKLDGFWFDAGTHDDLLDCANLIKAIETRTSSIVGYTEKNKNDNEQKG